ncbi:OmpA family protein [Maribacter algicola]|uniref:OmpA family protein n=1 Tax=Meishania litoralis TaxID=3434685 RepID=A0ACC7LJ80_9FLAO
MKKIAQLLKMGLPMIFIFAYAPDANGQFLKKLGKRAEKAAERAVERRVEKEATEKTDQVLDSILEPGSQEEKQKKNPVPNETSTKGPSGNGQNTDTNDPGGSTEPMSTDNPKTISVYSKFDFVPGDNQLFFDDFSNDFIGDFPSKWNTNGSGEVVTINQGTEKWFALVPGYSTYYVPDIPSLPEEYTIEFDVMATGLDKKTASTAILRVILTDDNLFKKGNFASVDIPFCQYHPIGFHVRNQRGDINNNIQGDIRQDVINQPHVSIAVNKERFRLWVNEKKYVDIPRMIPTATPPTSLKFEVINFKDGKERLFLKNLKAAEGGVDLRRKLITEGKISTNGILFDSGSSNIQPQSMGIIRQISQVLAQEKGMNLKIVGHTDSEGDDSTNMQLSEKRAEAVKNTLVTIYNVAADRLATAGKGESEPVGDNSTAEGKAQNRRVEFIKQ